jgi:anti-sigma factor RsiW
MENNFLLNDELLWDYADGLLDSTQQQQVNAYLEQHPGWKARLDAILSEKKLFSTLPLEQPKSGFADRVMTAWALEQGMQSAAKPGQDWVLRLIPALFALLILSPLVSLLGGSAPSINLPVEALPFKLPNFHLEMLEAMASSSVLFYTVLFVMVILTLRVFEQFLQVRFQYGKR